MTTELLRQALDALEAMQMEAKSRWCGLRIADEAIDAIRAHLARPQAEPVADADAIADFGANRVVHLHRCWQGEGLVFWLTC